MTKILSSAPKFALVAIVVTACTALFFSKLTEQNFMLIVGPVLAFFFAYKPKDSNGDINK